VEEKLTNATYVLHGQALYVEGGTDTRFLD
jgi:hypothetical protein